MQDKINHIRPQLTWAVPGFVALVLWSAFPEDLERILVTHLGEIHIYFIDLIHCLLLVASTWVLVTIKKSSIGLAEFIYLTFLAWLVVCTVRGFVNFGFRAFGEARYVIPFFGYLFPFAILIRNRERRGEAAKKLMSLVVHVAALTSLAMLMIEIVNGGRFFITAANQSEFGSLEDFRGIRYLGSTQTFNIIALVALLALKIQESRKLQFHRLLPIAMLLIAAAVTRNRTAILSVALAYLMTLLFIRRARQLIVIVLVLTMALVLIGVIGPEDPLGIGTSLVGALSPTEDATGIWRITLNVAAIEQGLSTPILGEGFGGYFYFLVPGMDPIEEPVHNQFILLFLKGGIVAVALCLTWMLMFAMQFLRLSRSLSEASPDRLWVIWLLIITASQIGYGMAYSFTPIYGFYLGCGAIILAEQSKAPNQNAEFQRL